MDNIAKKAADDLAQLTKNSTPADDFQAAYSAGGRFKEQIEAISKSLRVEELESVSSKEKEIEEVQEISSTPEVEPELEGYIEKVEKDPESQKALADDYVKTIGMQSATTQNPQVKIPLTTDQIQVGIHHKVWEAIHWLAVWCLRQMKMVSLKRA